jgi:hypothetical protein
MNCGIAGQKPGEIPGINKVQTESQSEKKSGEDRERRPRQKVLLQIQNKSNPFRIR